MNNKIIPFVLGTLVIGLTSIVVFAAHGQLNSTSKNSPTVTTQTTSEKSSTTTNTQKTAQNQSGTTYTMADVATHNSEASCWTAINGGVYDVTSWISQHPGGPEAIISLCGRDGSSAFNEQHGGQRRPASELATFKIGVLSN